MSSTSDASSATVTVRLIKSFSFKNYRNIVFHSLNLKELSLNDLKSLIWKRIDDDTVRSRLFGSQHSGFLDTFKLYYTPHSAKTNNAIINVGEDEKLVLFDYDSPLEVLGFQHETEISYFNWNDYQEYVKNPSQYQWE